MCVSVAICDCVGGGGGPKRFVSPARNYLLSVPAHNKNSMATCKYI